MPRNSVLKKKSSHHPVSWLGIRGIPYMPRVRGEAGGEAERQVDFDPGTRRPWRSPDTRLYPYTAVSPCMTLPSRSLAPAHGLRALTYCWPVAPADGESDHRGRNSSCPSYQSLQILTNPAIPSNPFQSCQFLSISPILANPCQSY